MTCKCTCGGCDCPQFKITYFPDFGAAPAVAPNIVTVDYTAACTGMALPAVNVVQNAAGAAQLGPLVRIDPW